MQNAVPSMMTISLFSRKQKRVTQFTDGKDKVCSGSMCPCSVTFHTNQP